MNQQAIHPIIYVRGYAMTSAEIEDTVSDPYMGFNLGSCKVRQLWDGRIKKYFFESPLVRLMKDYSYDDVYVDGIDQVVDPMAQLTAVPYRSIIIYRYYEPSSKDLGTGEKPNLERFATGLGELILSLRDRMYPKGKAPTPEEIAAGKPASRDDFRVYLVAHSMGGLVCRAFLQNPKLGLPAARKLVDKAFTYATPHNGIDVRGIGNVPDWLSLYGLNTFNRDEIAKLLALKKTDRDGEAVDIVTNFDADRFFNLVGTNPADYKVAGGLSSLGAGDASDGLVRIDNATTRGWNDQDQLVPSPQAFVHRSHSGYFGIVNSEEGYQNLTRFLFGDVRADGYLDIDELTLPPDVKKEYDAGKEVRASYLFEVSVSIRGKQWQLHRRTGNENSAIFRQFDELFPKKSKAASGRAPDRLKSPLLFNVFLDLDQRVVKDRPTVAFAADICVRVPEYTVAGFMFLRNHFEGDYLFRDLVAVEATPPATEAADWKIEYRFAGDRGAPPGLAKVIEHTGDVMTFEIPIEQPKPPGIKARLRVVTRFWNR